MRRSLPTSTQCHSDEFVLLFHPQLIRSRPRAPRRDYRRLGGARDRMSPIHRCARGSACECTQVSVLGSPYASVLRTSTAVLLRCEPSVVGKKAHTYIVPPLSGENVECVKDRSRIQARSEHGWRGSVWRVSNKRSCRGLGAQRGLRGPQLRGGMYFPLAVYGGIRTSSFASSLLRSSGASRLRARSSRHQKLATQGRRARAGRAIFAPEGLFFRSCTHSGMGELLGIACKATLYICASSCAQTADALVLGTAVCGGACSPKPLWSLAAPRPVAQRSRGPSIAKQQSLRPMCRCPSIARTSCG